MIKKILLFSMIISSFFLTGCTALRALTVGSGNSLSYSETAYKKSDITMVGIPTVLGVNYMGTTFPVTEHYSLTAAHVAHYNLSHVLAYNKDCDVALIRHDNTGVKLPTLKDLNVEDMVYGRKLKVHTYGYSYITDAPIESEGYIAGIFYDVNKIDSYENGNCMLVATTAGAKPGMSGGPAYDNHDNVAGVIVSLIYGLDFKHEYEKGESEHYSKIGYTFYVPLSSIQGWLVDEINKTEDKGQLKIINERKYEMPEGVKFKPKVEKPDSTLDY